MLFRSWFSSLSQEIQDVYCYILNISSELSGITAQTHHRISKRDLSKYKPDEKNRFQITGLLEVLKVLYNWNYRRPFSIVLFNGRFTPFSFIFHAAQRLGINTYVHERGITDHFAFYYNEIPSGGYSPEKLTSKLDPNVFNSISDSELAKIGRAHV